MNSWNVVPLCDKQLLDVDKHDILNDGLYRKCNVYKSGGGYDKLPDILSIRRMPVMHNQFVVQLRGCPFRCPYCYVTPEGVYGDTVKVSTEQLVNDFVSSGQEVFHLMGGAPALYIENWHKIIQLLPRDTLFHSDLMLIEKRYTREVLDSVANNNCIYAVSIKGYSEESYLANTGVKIDKQLLIDNLMALCNSKVNYYLTFTGMVQNEVEEFKQWVGVYDERIYKDSFVIGLINYMATQ